MDPSFMNYNFHHSWIEYPLIIPIINYNFGGFLIKLSHDIEFGLFFWNEYPNEAWIEGHWEEESRVV